MTGLYQYRHEPEKAQDFIAASRQRGMFEDWRHKVQRILYGNIKSSTKVSLVCLIIGRGFDSVVNDLELLKTDSNANILK